MRVLVADDDPATVAVLRGMLEHMGYEAAIARNGDEAWEALSAVNGPSLAILDWMMPGLEGPEICTRLREHKASSHKYVIMLTAKNDMEHLVQSFESGANDYLRKPFDERELRARLSAGVRVLLREDELRAKATFDDLTGLLNRSAIRERLKRELAHNQRHARPVSIVAVDLDEFKAVNDAYGHATGDEVLQESAKRLATHIRPYTSSHATAARNSWLSFRRATTRAPSTSPSA